MIEKALKDSEVTSLLLNKEYSKAIQVAFEKHLGQSSVKWFVDSISEFTGKLVRDLFEPIKNTNRFFQHSRISTEALHDLFIVYSNYPIFDTDILVVIYYLYPNIVLDEMSVAFGVVNDKPVAFLYLNGFEDPVFNLYNPPYVQIEDDGILYVEPSKVCLACTSVVGAWLESVWASNFKAVE